MLDAASFRRRAGSSVAVADASARQVVRTHFYPNAIAEQNSDAESAHLATRVGQQLMSVVKPDSELRVPQGVSDGAVHFERVTLGHQLRPPGSRSRSASVSSRNI